MDNYHQAFDASKMTTYLGFAFSTHTQSPQHLRDALASNFWCEGRVPKTGQYIRWRVISSKVTDTSVEVEGCYEASDK